MNELQCVRNRHRGEKQKVKKKKDPQIREARSAMTRGGG